MASRKVGEKFAQWGHDQENEREIVAVEHEGGRDSEKVGEEGSTRRRWGNAGRMTKPHIPYPIQSRGKEHGRS